MELIDRVDYKCSADFGRMLLSSKRADTYLVWSQMVSRSASPKKNTSDHHGQHYATNRETYDKRHL